MSNETLPLATKLKQTRFYITSDGVPMLVDDDGSCTEQQHAGGEVEPGAFHRYCDAKKARWAIRCPFSFSETDRLSFVTDDGHGSAAIEIAKRREARRDAARKEPRSNKDYEVAF